MTGHTIYNFQHLLDTGKTKEDVDKMLFNGSINDDTHIVYMYHWVNSVPHREGIEAMQYKISVGDYDPSLREDDLGKISEQTFYDAWHKGGDLDES